MVCCVTGHRPAGFPFPYGQGDIYLQYRIALRQKLEGLIAQGCTHFMTGMAMGADMDFAEEVLLAAMRHRPGSVLSLEAVIPCPEQTKNWHDKKQLERYQNILEACSCRTVVCPAYYPGCMQRRNRYLVDKADCVLAIWNGTESGGTWNTVCYARRLGKPILLLPLDGGVQNGFFR